MKSFALMAWRIRERALAKPQGFFGKAGRYLATKSWIHVQSAKGFFAPLSAKIEARPVFPHGLNGIFISGGARIGKHCVIFQQVTIGSNTLLGSRTFGSPMIGDSVYIGAGAKIIGRIQVGDNARIGANAVVTKDVPANATATGNNKIRMGEKRDNRFVSKTANGWVAIDSDGAHPIAAPLNAGEITG